MSDFFLVVDQGTTSSRAILFNESGDIAFVSQKEFPQHFPEAGWVEHDPEDIWQSVLLCCKDVIAQMKESHTDGTIKAIGITNQRETTLVWDRETGKAVYNAIVWQDRRTCDFCQKLKMQNHEAIVSNKTGLLLDPYFSATKIRWILENDQSLKARAENDELAFGTVDSFLLWRFTNGAVHATESSNASRTMIYNIHDNTWDDELLSLFDIPKNILPDVKNTIDDFGVTDISVLGIEIPIVAMAGDQQAATFGQACFNEGDIKSTYGTGCFVVQNTGDVVVKSNHKLLSTIAWRINGKTTYAREGSVFVAGSAIQFLRDGLGLVKDASETQEMAKSLNDNGGVYFVPALTGLGAPYWRADVTGMITGLRRDTTDKHIVRAALEAQAYQTADLFEAFDKDYPMNMTALNIDGGLVANDWVCQFMADYLNVDIARPKVIETTALGIFYMIGIKTGLFNGFDDIRDHKENESIFEPSMDNENRQVLKTGWQKAMHKVLH